MLHETDQLRTMYNWAADVVVWVNDIVSLRKELVAGETTNGVLVLAQERGNGLQDAIDAVYRKVADYVEEFTHARDELALLSSRWLGLDAQERAAVTSFVEGMESWMRGNLDWSRRSDRYQVADGVRLTTDTSLVNGPEGP
ncbi:terpene synthase family protein [Allokutzneria oryzae]|uniref:Terpene synthase n=1 Tax=Allokutzneria oryzae TaxID=1378989 RepID=A0ABV5ZT10_9PSEU